MNDWIGVGFVALLVIGAVAGLRTLAKPRSRTSDEFERAVSQGTTMLGATMNALQEAIDPSSARSKEVQMQMKDGRYQKKRREGKANADEAVKSGGLGPTDVDF